VSTASSASGRVLLLRGMQAVASLHCGRVLALQGIEELWQGPEEGERGEQKGTGVVKEDDK